MKSKTTAGVLALFLGGLGAHKFYLGRAGQGILYLVFFWTFIPALIALVEAIMYFTMSDADFNAKYNPGMMMTAMPQPQNIVVNVANTAQSGGGSDTVMKIKELHELKTAGLLTDVEFETQKQKILST